MAALILLLLAARSSLADHYVVPTGSMEPTLHPGDRVLVDKTAYGVRIPFTDWNVTALREPRRGDIAVFDSPEDGTRLIKRVVAVAGDRVSVTDGRLTINGRSLTSPLEPGVERYPDRAVRLDLRFGGGPDVPPTTVPEGHVLALGDSRGNSRDSRFFGFVPARRLYARALGIYFRSGDGLVWLSLTPEV
ncbi:MAG: signal peptidase I [Myxococcota bacterium]